MVKDSPAHPLRARAFRAKELLRVFVLGDDRCHATGLDATRADGGARPAHRGFIGGHKSGRPGQAREAGARKAGTAQIVVRATVAFIDVRLHVVRLFHCFVSLVRNSSTRHGLSGSAASGLLKSSLVPSGKVMLVTGLPVAFSACSIILLTLGLGGLRGWRGWRARCSSTSALIARKSSVVSAAKALIPASL